MDSEYLRQLKSLSAEIRKKAWRELHLQPFACHGVLSGDMRAVLAEVLRNEDDEDVHRMAVDILLSFSCCDCVEHVLEANAASRSRGRDHSLDGHMWTSFRRPSVVLHASGPGYKRRDAEAVQHVARRLSFKDFPATDFRPLPVGEKGWQEFTTTEPVEAICVVGRLGLLGQEAVAVLENREARFRFVQQERAKGAPTDTVRQSYHIHEYVDGQMVNEYRPLDRPSGRTDYGIVQLYRKFVGTRHVTVLLCAGCSSLGTMGAALWLARDLGRPTDTSAGRMPITKPASLGQHTTMEALVRSVCVPNSRIWRPSKIELLGLYVDHYQWSNSEMKWLDIQPHVIELWMRQGEPTLLKIDGHPAGFQPKSQNFRLAVRVVQQAHENNGGVDTVALANDVWIWGKSIDPSLVKQKLHRFSLTKLISFGHEIRLNAQVRIIPV